jgi:hypothetical protein
MNVKNVLSAVRDLSRSLDGAATSEPEARRGSRSDYHGDSRLACLTPDGEEAVRDALHALDCGIPRASVVLAWGALIDVLHEVAWRDRFQTLNQSLSVRKKPRTRESIRDVRDHEFLEAAADSGMLGNSRLRVLQSLLNERNHAGHVGSRSMTSTFAKHYLERVLTQADECSRIDFPN